MQNLNDLQKMADIYQGMLVLDTIPDSPSYRAGVRRGDILMEINGTRIKSVYDYIGMRDELDYGMMHVKVIRDDQEMEFSFDMDGDVDMESAIEHVTSRGPALVTTPTDDDGTLH